MGSLEQLYLFQEAWGRVVVNVSTLYCSICAGLVDCMCNVLTKHMCVMRELVIQVELKQSDWLLMEKSLALAAAPVPKTSKKKQKRPSMMLLTKVHGFHVCVWIELEKIIVGV